MTSPTTATHRHYLCVLCSSVFQTARSPQASAPAEANALQADLACLTANRFGRSKSRFGKILKRCTSVFTGLMRVDQRSVLAVGIKHREELVESFIAFERPINIHQVVQERVHRIGVVDDVWISRINLDCTIVPSSNVNRDSEIKVRDHAFELFVLQFGCGCHGCGKRIA